MNATRRDLALLASRLLAVEVDGPLLARLRQAPELLDPAVAALDDASALEELAVEYCRLFIGPQPVCPPYASAHLGGRRLGGRPEREFRAFLDAQALDPHGPADLQLLGVDHLAVQLAVLAHLHDRLDTTAGCESTQCESTQCESTQCESTQCESTQEALDELRTRHLDPWAADLADVLTARARVRPYALLGPILRGLLAP